MKQVVAQESILEYLKRLKPELKENEISKVGLFGSYAKNNANDNSDIDILIQSSDLSRNKLVGFKFFAYMEDVREKIKNQFNKNVDICDEIGLSKQDKFYVLDGVIYV